MKKIHVKPYKWDRDKPSEVEGVILNRTHGGRFFIPYEDIYSVADSLVDYAEQREADTED